LDTYDQKEIKVAAIFTTFKNQYLKIICVHVVRTIFITLWSFLFIVPGIIKSFSYSQALYIVKENPHIGIIEAIKESQNIMKGRKWNLFLTKLSFLGWVIIPIVLVITGGTIQFMKETSSFVDTFVYGGIA